MRVLVIGYGNPGRGDDGLGPALAQAIGAMGLAGVQVEVDYQLSVDHAAPIAAQDVVVFADAMLGLAEPFHFAPLEGQAEGLGSHQVSPQAAMELAGLLFGHQPKAWVLGMAGAAFGEVKEGLSDVATRNLALALAHLAGWLEALSAGEVAA